MSAHDAPRFLICRLSAVGDTVHTLPLACAIKQRWPRARVAWAVERAAAPLVQNHRAVDEAIVVPKGFLKSPREVWNLRSRLRKLRIDIALDPQSLTKSAVVAWLCGAKRRIGFSKPIGRELAPWLHSESVSPLADHVVRRYVEVLRPLGVHCSERDVRFDVPLDLAAESRIHSFLRQMRISGSFAVINPGAGWDSKLWPAGRYAAVARELSVPSVVVWAGERERAWSEAIVAGSSGQAVLAPPTSLLELAALVRRASVFLGSDTGPLHLAAAVGTPCVGIYGPTKPEVCGPYGSGHIVLSGGYDDLGSQRKRAQVDSESMLQITAQQTVEAMEYLLARVRSDAGAA